MSEDNIIEIENLSVNQQEHEVLSGVNINIKKGEFIYLIGRVGSGKTSLIKTLYGELPVVQGTGVVCGFNLSNLPHKQVPFLRRKIGIVFQDFQLLTDRNIYSNLLFVLKATGWTDKEKIEEKISEVLDKVNMKHMAAKMPHQISGGEQQRVVIARALLNDPELILADEPTGNLDPETSDGIMSLLLNISQSGCTVIMATHNYSLLQKYPARTFRCEKTKVEEISVQQQAFDLSNGEW